MKYTVSWTGGSFTTIWPLKAFGKYHTLSASDKRLAMIDDRREYTLLSSRGEDNIDKYHVRHLFNLTIRRK